VFLTPTSDFTATNGTTVVLASGATAGDTVVTESFYVSSVLNAIPATTGSVANAYLGPISTLPVTGGYTATLPAATGTVMVSGNMPAFSVYPSSAQTVASGTYTKILFDTKEFDTNNNFASSRFTPTVAGYYQITAGVYTNGASGESFISVYKNGSEYKRNSDSNYAAYLKNASALVYCNGSTDYVEIYAYQGSGSSATFGAGGPNTWFQGILVRNA
jgi:hypothetical protein